MSCKARAMITMKPSLLKAQSRLGTGEPPSCAYRRGGVERVIEVWPLSDIELRGTEPGLQSELPRYCRSPVRAKQEPQAVFERRRRTEHGDDEVAERPPLARTNEWWSTLSQAQQNGLNSGWRNEV
jgi:hypothetical protein